MEKEEMEKMDKNRRIKKIMKEEKKFIWHTQKYVFFFLVTVFGI